MVSRLELTNVQRLLLNVGGEVQCEYSKTNGDLRGFVEYCHKDIPWIVYAPKQPVSGCIYVEVTLLHESVNGPGNFNEMYVVAFHEGLNMIVGAEHIMHIPNEEVGFFIAACLQKISGTDTFKRCQFEIEILATTVPFAVAAMEDMVKHLLMVTFRVRAYSHNKNDDIKDEVKLKKTICDACGCDYKGRGKMMLIGMSEPLVFNANFVTEQSDIVGVMMEISEAFNVSDVKKLSLLGLTVLRVLGMVNHECTQVYYNYF